MPKACKNFINLCLSKYYHGTIFHRVVKNFIVQGGDPSGTGNGKRFYLRAGGESYDGKPFADEFHQRIKFVRRGLVAMANAGPNDNKSQFFITLSSCPDLNNKHTIFGTVVNNTIYNVLKMEELEVGDDDRPIVPPRILKTIVVENPFKDTLLATKKNSAKQRAEKYAEAFEHVQPIKNKKLLSFADDDFDEPIVTVPLLQSFKKIKSSHDVLDDPNLSKQPVLKPEELTIQQPIIKEETPSVPVESETVIVHEDQSITELKRLRAEQEALKASLKTTKRKVTQMLEKQNTSTKQDSVDEQELLAGFGPLRRDFTPNETIGEYLLSNSKYAKRKKVLPILNKTEKRELLTLELLRSFEGELSQLQQKAILKEKQKKGETEDVDLSTETDWMNHLLTFDKPSPHISTALDANVESFDRYDITDPRHPMNLRKNKSISAKK